MLSRRPTLEVDRTTTGPEAIDRTFIVIFLLELVFLGNKKKSICFVFQFLNFMITVPVIWMTMMTMKMKMKMVMMR